MAKQQPNVKLLTTAEMRASREARSVELAELSDPKAEAQRHELLFLKGLGSAQSEFDWLVEHAAWTDLGFGSAVEWWEQRVRPVMVQLEMRPTAEMADRLLAIVRETERALPPAQRRTNRELAELALVSDWKVRARAEKRSRRTAAGADLEGGTKAPLVDAMRGQIEGVADHQKKTAATGTHAAADEVSSDTTSATDTSAGTGGPSPSAGPGNPHTAAGRANLPADGDDPTSSTTGPTPAAGGGVADPSSPAVNPKDSPTGRDPEPEVATATEGPEVATPGQSEPDHTGHQLPAGEAAEDASLADDSAGGTAAGTGVPAAETDLEGLPQVFPNGSVDGREQQDAAGVSRPAAPGPEDFVGLSKAPCGAATVHDEHNYKYEAVDGSGTWFHCPGVAPPHPVGLLEELAEEYERLDVDVLGPLMTSEDFLRIEAALNRVAASIELLTRWHERAQP